MRTNRGPCLFLLAFTLVLACSVSARGEWVTQQAATNHDTGLLTSLALDRRGYPHISYYDQTHFSLLYASWSASGWYSQLVDTGYVGTHSSLAFYNDNLPRISYTSFDPVNQVANGVKYACLTDAGWTTQFVQTGSNVGEYTSLAVDSLGRPHVSYYDRSAQSLKYAVRNGSTWNIQTVDAVGSADPNSSLNSSLNLDSLDRPHIAYHNETAGTLRYAAYDATGWHYTTVDSIAHVGAHPSLALTGTGDPIISYFDSTNTSLKLAQFYNGGWHVGTVDTGGIVGFANSLALDPETNWPRIAYATGDPTVDTDLDFAYWDGNAWKFETIDEAGIVGEFVSMAIDPNSGAPLISYYDRTNGDLKFAIPSGAVIPEPATLSLLALAAVAAWTRRKKR